MKKSRYSNQYHPAFTIVELLIVIVIIGILVTIVIVAYNGIQNRATISSLSSSLDNASRILAADQIVSGAYPASLSVANNGQGISAGPGVTYAYNSSSTSYCMSATQNSISYKVTNDGEPKPGSCSGTGSQDVGSLIKWNTWTVGVGATGGYGVNGDGNSRITDTNPWGTSDVVWDVSNQDAASDADGGWNGSNFSIDNSKLYRFSVFVRRKNTGNGTFYFGTHGFPDPVLGRTSGTANANPYFYSAAWWGSGLQWYLVTGHIWPAGSGIGSSRADSGVYTMSGAKIASSTDFVWQPTTTSSNHRAYLYYSTDITTNQQFYQPRVDVVDGSEPSISELISGVY